MTDSRRAFLGRAAASAALGAATLAGLPRDLMAFAQADSDGQSDDAWDLSWPARLTAPHKAVFDVPEIKSGYGVWRLNAWRGQYQKVLGVKPTDLNGVLVLRHNGVALALQQAFWDRYGLGKLHTVRHPLTRKPTTKNPALLGAADGVPESFASASLPNQIAIETVVLACAVALQDCAGLIEAADKIPADAAYQKAVSLLVPGVILQPSGVFGCVRAQEAGCAYVRAS